MRLGEFISANVEHILAEWEVFAREIWPATAAAADPAELRDHAEEILRAAVTDMATTQTPAEQEEKSSGRADAGVKSARMSAASVQHASGRADAGFDVVTVIAEYRALRASVLRLWRDGDPAPDRRDLDDLTRFNEAIDQSIAEAVRSYTARVDRSRQLFLAILGHDLRNPLGAMKLTGQVIAACGQLTPDLLEMARSIPVNATAMSALIDDLLDFTGSELSGRLPTSPAPMDLGALCDQVTGELRAAAPGRPLVCRRQGDLAGVWDAGRLRQVLSNLLGNAVQHGDGAGGEPVTVTLDGTGADVTLAVHNAGTPIPPALLPSIFDPMTRGGADGDGDGHGDTAATRPRHLGLGLYIAKAAVGAHGGTIDVKSGGAGTTFTVRLPRHVPATAPREPR